MAQFSSPTTYFDHVICFVIDHIIIDVSRQADHMRQLVCFFSTLYTFPRCRRSYFERHFYTSK